MADSIYWIGSLWSDLTIRRAPLSGGGTVETLYSGSAQGVSMPHGLAIDSAAGRIYWTNRTDNTIRRAPLAGGGTVETLYSGPAQGVSEPAGIAVHPAGGRIYWASTGDGTIRRAPLSAGGPVETLYSGQAQGVTAPTGVTIDPAAGRIYWGNVGSGDSAIRRAPLVGSAGGGTVTTLYGPQQVSVPWWLAIDPDAGRVYWSNWNSPNTGWILGAALDGGGTPNTLYDNARGVTYAGGMAIDPNPAEPALPRLEANRRELGEIRRFSFSSWLRDLIPGPSGPPPRIYWGNGATTAANPNNNTIQRAPVAGGGAVDTLYGSAQGVGGPAGLALLRAPIAVAPPTVGWQFTLTGGGQFFGGSHSSPLIQRLGCGRGTWAPDLLGSFLYRAPQSFAYQWRLNGTDLGGANSAQYNPTAPGSYSCRVTATNAAGSATQMSAAFAVSSSMLPSP